MPDELADYLISQAETARDTRRQLGELDKVTGIQTKRQGVVKVFVKRYVISLRNVSGDSLIWGNSSLGVWGVNKWGNVANASFILSSSYAGILGTCKLGSQNSDWEVYYDSGDLE